jgi:hypothetical protein
LENVNIPKTTVIEKYAFNYCSCLSTLSFPYLESIGDSAFAGCYSLKSIYLLNSTVATLHGVEALYDTPLNNSSIFGYFGLIFVRQSLLSSWKTADSWSYYSERFVGLTDEEIE